MRELPLDEAGRGRPVELTGVVTHTVPLPSGGFTNTVVHDRTAGVYVGLVKGVPPDFGVGSRVRIRGKTSEGRFAPTVDPEEVEVQGRGELPPARPVTFDRMLTGAEDAQRVEVAGVVRAAAQLRSPFGDQLTLIIGMGGQRLHARVTACDPAVAARLVDAEVRVQGVCSTIFNERRQHVRPSLWVAGDDAIQITVPARPEPLELSPVASLRRFEPNGIFWHRARIQGAVTACPDHGVLYVEDGSQGIRVEAALQEAFPVGARVEALGFPAPGGFGPVLKDAVVRGLGPGTPSPPAQVAPAQAFAHHSQLVRMRGRVTAIGFRPGEEQLVLQQDGVSFLAVLRHAGQGELLGSAGVGSAVEVTGICEAELGAEDHFFEWLKPASFSVQLRSPDDVRVLVPGPWWTRDRIQAALLAVLGCGVLVLGAAALRTRARTRRQQFAQAAAQERFAAVLEERTRLAREVHDTLAQGLTGISVQLEVARRDLLAAPDHAREHLELARSLVRESLEEARRFVWAMRSQVLEGATLGEALRKVASQLTSGTDIHVDFTLAGEERPLPQALETHLLRAGQEALTNAVRHAAPRLLEVSLRYGAGQVELEVRDDGHGFAMESQGGAASSNGFGLRGIAERVRAAGGVCAIDSSPSGTRVRVQVPA